MTTMLLNQPAGLNAVSITAIFELIYHTIISMSILHVKTRLLAVFVFSLAKLIDKLGHVGGRLPHHDTCSASRGKLGFLTNGLHLSWNKYSNLSSGAIWKIPVSGKSLEAALLSITVTSYMNKESFLFFTSFSLRLSASVHNHESFSKRLMA